MTLFRWSKVAANNGTADTTCPFPEGMGAPALNDGARGMMAAVSKFRDDSSGAILTGGAVNAYTVSSNQGFDTLAHLDGMAIAFSPHITNTGAVQVNVDGLGLKPYRPSPGVDFIGGELIQGTPYVGVYNNAAGEIYARGFMSSPYAVPFLAGIDYWDTIAPNSAFIFPLGQAISRTAYARAFARWGTTHGAGDGATTFNVPDKVGRVSAMRDPVGIRITGSIFNSTDLGGSGGAQSHVLTVAEMPSHSHAVTDPGHAHTEQAHSGAGGASSGVKLETATDNGVALTNTPTASAATGISVNANGGGAAHAIVQPTIICNYIIRIL